MKTEFARYLPIADLNPISFYFIKNIFIKNFLKKIECTRKVIGNGKRIGKSSAVDSEEVLDA